jgi:hypothetical protein
MFFYCPLKTFAGHKRAQYMKQYTRYRKMQGEIKVKSDKLADFNQKLNVQKQ